jgi:hypothetical protein
LLLRSALRHNLEQFQMQINGVARHEISFDSNVAQIHRASASAKGLCRQAAV